jgi:molybdenum cofactor cytidylyltransferase
MHDTVVGLVLGAGLSTRLGRPKQSLVLGDTTLLGWVVREAQRSSLARVVVVVGDAAVADGVAAVPGRVTVVRNEAPESGCVSSLKVGLDAAEPCDALMLLLGDMPGADAAVIDEVLAAGDRSTIAVAEYRDGVGHPFVFPAATFPVLRALHGDKAVWKLAAQARRVVVDRGLPRDVDTWDDYVEVCKSLGVIPQLQSVT